ncbi:MAG: 50S ribosomal protein L18a [Nanohaloarchaea archaeon QH_8_44_6]|nr:MAG: 50S ribosomal protein L18a [Nanohaloarchaea archaeon QH_8_44_6]
MTTYVFSGEVSQGRGVQPFEREVEAETQEHAREKLYATLGSEHSIKRTKIDIQDESEA